MAGKRTRVALVTGANRGLGLETARQLLARGLNVVLAGRDTRALEHALGGLGRVDERAMVVRMDVTSPSSIQSAQRAVAKRFGGVDVLVNNAAVLLFESEDVLSIPADAYQSTFETNVFGAIEAARVFVPAMAAAGYGRVVNVSSGAGTRSCGWRCCRTMAPPVGSFTTGARSSGDSLTLRTFLNRQLAAARRRCRRSRR